MNIGPIPVPPALEPYVPYLKFIAAVAGVVATAVITLVAVPPAWAYIVVVVTTALGVYTVPNSAVEPVLSDGMAAFTAAEDAVESAKAGNLAQARQDALNAVADSRKAVTDVQGLAQFLPKI